MSAPDAQVLAQWADARRWLTKADEDIRSADLMLLAEPPLVEQAAFHCQQAAEKIIKGLLVAAAILVPRTHDVERLADLATPSYPPLRPMMDELVQTTAWNAATRYPDLGMELGATISDVAEILSQLRKFRQAAGALDPTPT
jgi:HEPN domain-containing protein